MGDILKPIKDYPDFDFIDGYTLEKLNSDMLQWFQEKYLETTGEAIVLASADKYRILLQAAAYYLFIGYKMVDNAGKMNTLKYSYGNPLINLGAMKHVYPRDAKGATTTIRFSMDSWRDSATGIPKGTRLTAGDGIYFATNDYTEIPIGALYADIRATCTTGGKLGNIYAAGEIKYLVDPVPMVDRAVNITASEGGTDKESEDDLKEEIYVAPDGYTSGGSNPAYEKMARDYNTAISDVVASTTKPCEVNIICLLENGEIPGDEFLSGLQEYMMQPGRKMLTDKVFALAPAKKEFEVSFTYWINNSDKDKAGVIGREVGKAVEEYVLWQRSRIGRDINPDELQRRIMAAGAKRMRITKPAFTVVNDLEVACPVDADPVIVYGGLEDD